MSEPTSEAMSERPSEHELNAELLNAELPDPRFVDGRYLSWLYDENPFGRGFTASADEDGRRMAHYAVVPQRYRNRDGEAKMVFSLNACTRSGAQRKGYFSTLGEQVYAEAAEWGALGVIGISNANSTPPVVKRLDFRLLGPLPVRVVPAVGPAARVRHTEVNGTFLASADFAEITADLDASSAEGWTNCWTLEALQWRLAAPNVASPYWVHLSDDLFAVSARGSLAGRKVPVVLKLCPRGGRSGPLPSGPLVRAICRFHRAPFAVYAGFNRHVPVRGLRPPRRLQPSPLNLIYRSLSTEAPKESFVLDTFEFLDMDAY